MSDATVSAAGMRMIKLLVGNPPQTIADLIRATGVTRTAVTEQLNELVAAGFVERSTERLSGRGRPRHRYKTTQSALLLLTDGQHVVVPAIWRAVYELGGDDLTRKVLRRTSRHIADHYSGKLTAKKPEERLKQFIEVLTAEGVLIETFKGDDGRLLISKRSCPFFGMVDERRSVCWIDQDMMGAVVGRPIWRLSCRHDGAPCCTFHVDG